MVWIPNRTKVTPKLEFFCKTSVMEGQQIDVVLRDGGFLGQDETFKVIVKRDKGKLRKQKIRSQQIADRLETLTQKYYNAHGFADKSVLASFPPHLNNNTDHNNARLVEGKFVISNSRNLEVVKNPFGGKNNTFRPGCVNYLIYNLDNKRIIRFNDVLIEMIRDQTFFLGNVPQRVSPAELISTLELVPGKDYKPQYKCVTRWSAERASTRVDTDFYGKYDYHHLDDIQYFIDNGRLYILNPKNVTRTITIEGYPLTVDMQFMICSLKTMYVFLG